MLKKLFILLSVCYPMYIYFGLQYCNNETLILLLIPIFFIRMLIVNNVWEKLAWLTVALCLVSFSWYFSSEIGVKLYPVIINAALLIVFASSLWFPPSAVERIARLSEPDLPDHAITYTHNVTKVWCVFFFCNGLTAMILVLQANDQWWAIYNGIIAYILMALLMLVEYFIRQKQRARYE